MRILIYFLIFIFFISFVYAGDYVKLKLNMTDYNVPSPYIVTNSTQNGANNAGWGAFDGIIDFSCSSISDCWQTSGFPFFPDQWIQTDLGSEKILTIYSICVYTTGQYEPENFSLEGSLNLSEYYLLDNQMNQSITGGTCQNYTVNNNIAYRYYRLNITQVNGGSIIVIPEIELYINTTSEANCSITDINISYPINNSVIINNLTDIAGNVEWSNDCSAIEKDVCIRLTDINTLITYDACISDNNTFYDNNYTFNFTNGITSYYGELPDSIYNVSIATFNYTGSSWYGSLSPPSLLYDNYYQIEINTPIVNITNITTCGNYTITNNIIPISIENVTSICLNISLNNVTLYCSQNYSGSGSETFINIISMNDTIIENCNFNNFNNIFTISNGQLIGNNNNNIIRNITFNGINNAFIGFDVESAYSQLLNNTKIYNINGINNYNTWTLAFFGDGIDNLYIHDILINNSYSGVYANYVKHLNINKYIFNSGTIYGIYLENIVNPIISNSSIDNVYICGFGLLGVENILLYNNSNEYNNFEMTIAKFCSDTATINPLSSYNIGWFPSDYTNNFVSDLIENSYYNMTHSYDVIISGVNDILIQNYSKYYFIFPACNWIKQVTPCLNGVKIIEYKDNTCNISLSIPSDNNTLISCIIPSTEGETNITNSIYIIALLIVVLIGIYIFNRGVQK